MMPAWLRRYLASQTLRAHFLRALLIGAILRAFSAFFVYGPQALDDYKHGVWPAYQFYAGLPLDLPDYRSQLLVWFLSLPLYPAGWLGVNSALGQVRAMYFFLGAVSLLAIVGTYFFARAQRSRIFGGLALYLVAAFPLMPFVGTRAFGEAVALALTTFAIGYLEFLRSKRHRGWMPWTGAFAILGLAVLFRFHVGLIFIVYAAILLYLRNFTGVVGALIGGLITLGGQAAVDVLSGKAPLGTLFIYLAENEGGGAKYGVSPWYNPWLFVLGLTLAPFSFTLWRGGASLWRRLWPVLVPLLVFVSAHSIAAHKEERFLYPILGIELWALALLWTASAFQPWARRVYTPALLIISLLALPVVCLINTQEGEIEPPALIERRYGSPVVYLDHESLFGRSRFQFYFLRPPSTLEKVGTEGFTAGKVDRILLDNPEVRAVVMLTSVDEARDLLSAMAGLETAAGRCQEVRESGSLIDRLLYSLNPKHNQRRRPTWYVVCERGSDA